MGFGMCLLAAGEDTHFHFSIVLCCVRLGDRAAFQLLTQHAPSTRKAAGRFTHSTLIFPLHSTQRFGLDGWMDIVRPPRTRFSFSTFFFCASRKKKKQPYAPRAHTFSLQTLLLSPFSRCATHRDKHLRGLVCRSQSNPCRSRSRRHEWASALQVGSRRKGVSE